MDAIRRYVITLTAAAMLCALVKAITAGRKGQEKILSLVCGIFLLATALGPLGLLRLPDLSDPTAQVQAEAGRMASQAEDETKRQMAAIISEEAASYILDKADALGLQLEVQVELDAELLPCGVRLQGAASPYARSQLSGQIETELGIPKREAGVVLMKESGPVWETLRRLPQRLGKFKYPVLILLLGVLLLLLPRPSGREAEPEATAPAVEERLHPGGGGDPIGQSSEPDSGRRRCGGDAEPEIRGANPLPNRYAAPNRRQYGRKPAAGGQYGPVRHRQWHTVGPGAAGDRAYLPGRHCGLPGGG